MRLHTRIGVYIFANIGFEIGHSHSAGGSDFNRGDFAALHELVSIRPADIKDMSDIHSFEQFFNGKVHMGRGIHLSFR